MRRARLLGLALVGAGGLTAAYMVGGNLVGYMGFRSHFARVAEERRQGPTAELAESCTYCHGERGAGRASFYPPLAGQPAPYLLAQLTHFAEGSRHAPAMEPLARGLSDRQRQSLARWFAAQPPRAVTVAVDGVLAGCTSCHGEKLEGATAPLLAPRLVGLGRQYVMAQLRNFRSGQRAAGDGGMNAVARGMGDGDIEAVAGALAGE